MCHVVDGGSDCAFSQGDDIIVRKACFLHSLGKGGKEEGAVPRLAEGLEEGVVFDSEVLEEYCPPIPAARLLILGLTCCAILTVSFPSMEHSQESISNGSGTILKLRGS